MSHKNLNFADLFCGAGGLSSSFKNKGHKLLLAIDNDKYAIETLKHNFKKSSKLIQLISIEEFLKRKKKNLKLDLVIGGPPCQGFSTANRQNIINDPRNKLYKYFLDFIKIYKPKYILIENVIGIKTKAKDIINSLKKINYHVDFKILKAADFGIPQNRKRLFFFGVNKKERNYKKKVSDFFKHLSNQNKKKYLLKDALFGLPKLTPMKKKNDTKNEYIESGINILRKKTKTNNYIELINNKKKIKYIYNQKARYNNLRDIEIFKKLPQGADSTHSSIQDIMPYKNRSKIFKDKYYKLTNNKICKTITSHMKFDCNMYIHPTQARGLSPREAARIQSFPDDYFFVGPVSKCYSQIGNAVPPLLSLYICKAIEKIND